MTSSATSRRRGSVKKNAIVDLRCMALRRAERGRPRAELIEVCSAASAIAYCHATCVGLHTSPLQGEVFLRAHEAFDLGLGPSKRLFQRLALHEANDHLRL